MISQLKTLDIEIRIHISDCLINTKKNKFTKKLTTQICEGTTVYAGFVEDASTTPDE